VALPDKDSCNIGLRAGGQRISKAASTPFVVHIARVIQHEPGIITALASV